jgi:hypothetical protein
MDVEYFTAISPETISYNEHVQDTFFFSCPKKISKMIIFRGKISLVGNNGQRKLWKRYSGIAEYGKIPPEQNH